MGKKKIYTIGHSTRTFDELVEMLQSFGIKLLVDIRNYPGSRLFSHFNKEYLEKELPGRGIRYIHIKALGGRRKPLPDSKNTAWRVAAFRGYADYMETADFKNGIDELQRAARQERTACMCSDAVWWRCHRLLVADYLKSAGWTVIHIMGVGKAEEHPYTSPARIVDGKLTYTQADTLWPGGASEQG